jgi:hypothetical protein
LDGVLENLLGEMESAIARAGLGQLIASPMQGELSGQQSEDAAAILASDLSIIRNMMSMKRKQERETSVGRGVRKGPRHTRIVSVQ